MNKKTRNFTISMVILLGLILLFIFLSKFNLFTLQPFSVVGQAETKLTQSSQISIHKEGDWIFSSSAPDFICKDKVSQKFNKTTGGVIIGERLTFSGDVSAPQPSNECWLGNLQVDELSTQIGNLSFMYNQEKTLNKYIDVRWQPEAKVYFGEKLICPKNVQILKRSQCSYMNFFGEYVDPENDWRNHFYFKLHGDFLDIYPELKNPLIKIGETKKVSFKVYNDLINNIDGGLWYKVTYFTLHTEQTFSKNIDFKKGNFTYEIEFTPEQIGLIKLEITPFINFFGGVYYANNSIIQTYNTVPNIDLNIDTSVDCTNKICPDEFYCWKGIYNNKNFAICQKEGQQVYQKIEFIQEEQSVIIKTNNQFIIGFILAVALIIVIIIVSFRLRKKQK